MGLLLSRKVGETIRIGSDITVTVAEIRGSRAKLLVDAPREVVVLRGELEEREEVRDES